VAAPRQRATRDANVRFRPEADALDAMFYLLLCVLFFVGFATILHLRTIYRLSQANPEAYRKIGSPPLLSVSMNPWLPLERLEGMVDEGTYRKLLRVRLLGLLADISVVLSVTSLIADAFLE
jgi:hypothetical protein